jgi:hypothetical protein
MKKKLPSLTRTPSGLKKQVIEAVKNKADGISAEAVRRVIEEEEGAGGGDDEDADIKAAREFLSSVKSVEPLHVWWILANRDLEAAQAAELGLNDEEDNQLTKAMKMLRKRYVYAARRDEVWDRQARDWISTRALSNAQAHAMPLDENGNPHDAMKVLARDKYADRVHNERYMPGVDSEIAAADGVDWLNTWRKSDLVPAKGDPTPMLNHILYLCGGRKELASHLTDWIAFQVQNPGVKVNHAPLIISGHQGVGKDALSDALIRIFGEWNTRKVSEDMISEGRYEFMKRAQLIVVPETMSGDRKDLAHKLKPLITQTTVTVNEKNVKPYEVQNVSNFIMFSNHENAAHIEDNDRRYFVVICREKPKDPQYYVDLYNYIEGDGLAGFAWFLANRDLSNFNPKAPALNTPDKAVVKEACRGNWEAWLDDAWQSGAAPFDRDVINTRDAVAAISAVKGAPRISVRQVRQFLEKVGGGDLGKPRMSGGKQVRVFAVRDFEELKNAPKEVIALAYEGVSWRQAVLELQRPREYRNMFTLSQVERAKAAAADTE